MFHSNNLGYLTGIGIILLLLISGFFGVLDFPTAINEWRNFFTGRIELIPEGNIWTPDAINVFLSLLGIELVVVLGVLMMINASIGKPQSFDFFFEEWLAEKGIKGVLLLCIAEELVFRAVFGGIGFIVNDRVGMWWGLMIGNVFFALIHLGNYLLDEDKNILRVLPQLLSGTTFAYMYMKYGFAVGVLMHFFHNSIIFSTSKQDYFGIKEIIDLLGNLILCGFVMLMRPDFELIANVIYKSQIPTHSFWEWFWVLMGVGYIGNVVGGILLFDTADEDDKTRNFFTYMVLNALTLLLILLLNWLLELFFKDVLIRASLISLFLITFLTPKSGSAMAYLVLLGMPMLFLQVLLLTYYGFWFMTGLFLVFYILGAAQRQLRNMIIVGLYNLAKR